MEAPDRDFCEWAQRMSGAIWCTGFSLCGLSFAPPAAVHRLKPVLTQCRPHTATRFDAVSLTSQTRISLLTREIPEVNAQINFAAEAAGSDESIVLRRPFCEKTRFAKTNPEKRKRPAPKVRNGPFILNF